MVSKPFVSGWALIVIGCCGNGSPWVNGVCGLVGLLIVFFSGDEESKA
jgi:hypothetical protein